MEELKCPSNNPEPSCPNDMNPRKLETGVTCCFKGKPKTDLTKRKRIQKSVQPETHLYRAQKIIR